MIDSESLYRQLGHLLANVPPDLTVASNFNAPPGPLSTEAEDWLARAYALVAAGGDPADIVEMRQITTNFGKLVYRQEAARPMFVILRRTAAEAELKSPAALQGAFLP